MVFVYIIDKKEESDSFGEKLATNVIKNLQVCLFFNIVDNSFLLQYTKMIEGKNSA